METVETSIHTQNTWANDVTGKPIHITAAPSGRRGYFCLGCANAMQAVKSGSPFRASYFRHDPKGLPKNQVKCTYSDETHRHVVAKEILQRLKTIKVPVLNKYAPPDMEGPPMLLMKPHFVIADQVRNELYFYEMPDGQVGWSKKLPSNVHELVKPDVAFFNQNGFPILLIELEATHKVHEEKKARLRRLGIDAVEVSLPTGPFEEIEEAFKTTHRTKWLYNAKEHGTSYVRPADRGAADVSSIDELQKQLFEETYACRKSIINNLIRTIDRYLESEPHRSTEERLRADLARTTENADRTRIELRRVQEGHKRTIESGFAEEVEELESTESELRQKFEELERRSADLETRYFAKRNELEDAEGAIHEDLKRAERNPAIRGKEIEKQSDQIGFANEGIRASLDELKRTENRELGEASTEDKRLEQESSELEAEEGGFPQWTREQDRDWRAEQDRLIREEEGSIRILERDTIEESGSLEHRKEQLRTEFEELRRRVTETVANRSVEGGSKLAERIKAVLSNGEHLASIAEAECDRKRTKSIVQDLRSGKFETWYRPS
ncbi:MAG: hypothetical protein LKM36_09020 [Flavobacteriales bacterium]|jgi:hypothetical protein|nr:hypothetical protein [Flavobacteriales bacterium]